MEKIILTQWIHTRDRRHYRPGITGEILHVRQDETGRICYFVLLEDNSERVIFEEEFTILEELEEKERYDIP